MKPGRYVSTQVAFFLAGALVFALALWFPADDWDMIGYIASAKAFEEQGPEALHKFAFDEVRKGVPESTYDYLVNGTEYRRVMARDPAAFREQLPFYQIRPVYTGLIYLLYNTGMNSAFATHLISVIAVVAAIFFLYLLSVSFLDRPYSYAVPLLAVIFGVIDIARSSSPDSLALLAVVLSSYLYLKRHTGLLFVLLPVMVGVRSDLIVFVLPFSLLIFLVERPIRWKAGLSALLSLLVYIGIAVYWKNPGWSTIFYTTLVNRIDYPLSNPPTVTVRDYFQALYSGIRDILMVSTPRFFLYVLLVLFAAYFFREDSKRTSFVSAIKSPFAALTIVCLLYTIGHFLAFPVLWARFFCGPFLITAVSLLAMANSGAASKEKLQIFPQ
jgi:hypothetical protein